MVRREAKRELGFVPAQPVALGAGETPTALRRPVPSANPAQGGRETIRQFISSGASSRKAVHTQKVIVDCDKFDQRFRKAIGHAHDPEGPNDLMCVPLGRSSKVRPPRRSLDGASCLIPRGH